MALNFSPEDQAWLEAMFRRVLAEGNTAPPTTVPWIAINDYKFIQTPAFQKWLPGSWGCTNLQLMPGAPGRDDLTPDEIDRICLNVGCDKDGNLLPAAFRNFQSGSSVDEAEFLKNCTGTFYTYDIKNAVVGAVPVKQLDTTRTMHSVLGLAPGTVEAAYALRAVSWDAIEKWCEWLAGQRAQFKS